MIETIKITDVGAIDGVQYIKIPRPEHFDIAKIFDCGQCFRFDPSPLGGFEGVALGKYLRIAEDGDSLVLYGTDESDFEQIWYEFLGLGEDYGAINDEILSNLNGDEVMSCAICAGDGIRILHQDCWETLCSFIISQNNNIPRIKKIIDALCRALGEKICVKDREFYAFPTPQAVLEAGEDFIFSLKTGFRAKYIIAAAEAFASLPTDDMTLNMSYDEAQQLLTAINGVGPKVSSCVLLFGFGRYEAFPIDVWIKKVLEKYYDGKFDPTRIGRYAGIAQQYLFYYERYDQNK